MFKQPVLFLQVEKWEGSFPREAVKRLILSSGEFRVWEASPEIPSLHTQAVHLSEVKVDARIP